jgi:serine protease AprX
MKRRLFLLSFCLLFASSLFGQSVKLDDKIKDKINKGKKTEKIRVIIQHRVPATATDKNDIKAKGKIKRELPSIRAIVAEMTVDQVQKASTKPNVTRISIDEPVRAHAAEPGVVSGATLAAQTYGVTGAGIGIAVIDSGIAAHPDLPNVVKSVDFVSTNQNGGYDPFGHGTHVAGIIGGSGAASGGAHKGVAPGVKLIDLRVLGADGSGYTSDVLAALEWAIDHKNGTGSNGQPLNIRVINLSLGHRPFEPTAVDPLTTLCRLAVENGIVVVAAAGNFGKDGNGNLMYGGITSPGNEPAVLTVGAMTAWGTDNRTDDTVATYSSRGPTAFEHIVKPDIAAPGSQIIAAMSPNSLLATSFPQLQSGGSYLRLSGTSMATPVVAGSVALMLQQNPTMTPNTVKGVLMFTAEHRNADALSVGAGYINVAGAVNMAANINSSAPANQYWLINGGIGLNYTNVIGGSPVVWGQTLVWDNGQYSGSELFYNTSVWDQGTVWGEPLVWAETIVWELLDAMSYVQEVGGLTIVWETVEGLTIVWDEL